MVAPLEREFNLQWFLGKHTCLCINSHFYPGYYVSLRNPSASGLLSLYYKFPSAEVPTSKTNTLKFKKQTTRQTDLASLVTRCQTQKRHTQTNVWPYTSHSPSLGVIMHKVRGLHWRTSKMPFFWNEDLGEVIAVWGAAPTPPRNRVPPPLLLEGKEEFSSLSESSLFPSVWGMCLSCSLLPTKRAVERAALAPSAPRQHCVCGWGKGSLPIVLLAREQAVRFRISCT